MRLTYAPPAKFLTAFAEERYQTRNSNIKEWQYDEVRTTVGVAIAY